MRLPVLQREARERNATCGDASLASMRLVLEATVVLLVSELVEKSTQHLPERARWGRR